MPNTRLADLGPSAALTPGPTYQPDAPPTEARGGCRSRAAAGPAANVAVGDAGFEPATSCVSSTRKAVRAVLRRVIPYVYVSSVFGAFRLLSKHSVVRQVARRIGSYVCVLSCPRRSHSGPVATLTATFSTLLTSCVRASGSSKRSISTFSCFGSGYVAARSARSLREASSDVEVAGAGLR